MKFGDDPRLFHDADGSTKGVVTAFYKNGRKQLRLEAQDDVYVPQRIESRDDR